MGLNLFTVQPLFSGEVFAQYKLILLPFSVRNLIAPQPQTIVPTPSRQAHPLLRMSLGRLSPPFLYSFSLLSKTATSSLFVIHFTEISPSTSEKHRFLQYSSPANHDSQPYSARHIPSFGGAWGGSASLSILFRRGLGRPLFHFSNISVHSPTCSQILKI